MIALKLKQEIIVTLSEREKLQQAKVQCVQSLDCPNTTNHNHVYLECIKPDAKCREIHARLTEIDKQLSRNASRNRYFWQQLFFECRDAIRKNDVDFFDGIFKEFTPEEVCNYTEIDGENLLYNAVVFSRIDIVKKIMPFTKKETINSMKKSALELATGEIKTLIETLIGEKA
jgi:hypothetical protein